MGEPTKSSRIRDVLWKAMSVLGLLAAMPVLVITWLVPYVLFVFFWERMVRYSTGSLLWATAWVLGYLFLFTQFLRFHWQTALAVWTLIALEVWPKIVNICRIRPTGRLIVCQEHLTYSEASV